MKTFMEKYGKALDITGAFLFIVGCVASSFYDAKLLGLAFFVGAFAFGCSMLVWTIRDDNEADLSFYENDGMMRGMCAAFATLSAVLFVLAFIAWVIA